MCTKSQKLAHEMGKMSEKVDSRFAVFLRLFLCTFSFGIVIIGHICADVIWLKQIKHFICRVC